MRVLVTRPEPDLAHTVAAVRAAGHTAVSCPVLEIRHAKEFVPDGDFSGLILTSRHAVAALVAAGAVARFAAHPVAAVGARTAEAARSAGFARVLEGGGDVGSMIDGILAAGWRGVVLYPSGADIAGDPAPVLGRNGIAVRRVVAYAATARRTLAADAVAALGGRSVDGALFYSARTVAAFSRLARDAGVGDRLDLLSAFCLSETIAERAANAGFGAVHAAREPTEAALIGLLGSGR